MTILIWKINYNYNINNKTILDVGCGFGDFYKFLILKRKTNSNILVRYFYKI